MAYSRAYGSKFYLKIDIIYTYIYLNLIYLNHVKEY